MSIQQTTITYNWVIENFNAVQNAVSEQFQVEIQPEETRSFSLIYFPNNNKSGWRNYASIGLTSSCTNAKVDYTISIVDSHGDKKCSQEMSGLYKGSRCQNGSHYYIWNTFLKEPENGLVNDNKLTIHCEIRIHDYSKQVLAKIVTVQNEPNKICNECEVVKDYNSLLESGKFSDAVLVIGDKQFQVHKNILGVRSPVFASMFEHECIEKLNNRVELTDIEVEVCEEMLRYIYTGKVGSLKEYALELFIAADKYQLDSLKSICGASLRSSMSIETICKVVVYADMHSEGELKSKCIEFITENCTKVMDTQGWKVGKTQPELLMELYQDIATKAQPFLKLKSEF